MINICYLQYVASPVVQVQKQSDGSTSSGSRRQLKEEMNNAAVSVKIVNKQKLKPRFAVELDGLNCFETLVPR